MTASGYNFSIESEVNGSKGSIWNHITQMKNVNAELFPFCRMTYPSDMSEIGGQTVPMNTVLFASVILLFGLIPIDLHYLKFSGLEDGHFFHENSYTFTHIFWKHSRTISERNGKVYVLDDLSFSPRIPLIGYILLPLYKLIFANRHRILRNSFSL